MIFTFIILILLGCFSLAWGADRGTIRSGETKVGFHLAGPSFIDIWTFNSNEGDRVLLGAIPTSGSTAIYISLYPPDTGPREAVSHQRLDHQLRQTGLYTMVIEENYRDAESTYNLSLDKIPSQLRPGLYNPHPSNGAIISDLSDFFSWDPAPGATGYVYFGENVIVPLIKIGNNIRSPSTPFPAMNSDNIYYWHVVARTSGGYIEGPYWWFETTDSTSEPLLYSPIAPCRIVDTRSAGGIISASSGRNFYVHGSAATISAQGGNAAGCQAPMGEPRAAHINMVAVDPNGKGNLQAFPKGASPGAGMTVNYNTIDTNLANAGSVKTSFNTGTDITVYSGVSSAHTVIDVLGYYYDPLD